MADALYLPTLATRLSTGTDTPKLSGHETRSMPGVLQAAQFAMLMDEIRNRAIGLRTSKLRGESLESTIWKNSSGSGSGVGAFVICSSTPRASR
jgi:hypothetical protein